MTTPLDLAAANQAALDAGTALESAQKVRAARAEFIADEVAGGRPVHGLTVTAYLAARNEARDAMHLFVAASNAALAMGAEFANGDAA